VNDALEAKELLLANISAVAISVFIVFPSLIKCCYQLNS